MGKKIKRNKEEIAEDWCFVCKDGGLMRVCDYGDCLKTYHPSCVEKDDSFLEADHQWTCPSHFCLLCRKASKFTCFCCPTAFCGRCVYDADFAVVKRKKGLCSHCIQIALLFEKVDVHHDGGKIDFKNPDTYECLFAEYYEIVKQKEGLKSQHVYSAHKLLKCGRNKDDFNPEEMGEGGDDAGESEDDSNFIVSDYEDLNDTARNKSVRKKKRCVGKIKSTNGKLRDKKKEFIGWGSRILIEFLDHAGKDTSREFSEYEVVSIIMDYCRENKLFDPEKKRKVLCDAALRCLLGRKAVNKNNIHNLITQHFAENVEETEVDISSSSENKGDNKPSKSSMQRKLISSAQSRQNVVSEEQQSYFAAIVSSNLKLVYLKRSLMEELLIQLESFDNKVTGTFVRVKCDPYDYLQKNSHKLERVLGINRSKNGEINKDIMLKLSNVPKDVPICKISDDDFTEEECKDLYQRMRNGLLKQPTVLELDQKARSLREDIIKHWIPREIKMLQNRIDQANEKGWRRELKEYMEQKLKLETSSEQSRLVSDIPKVIPEIVETELLPEGSPREDIIEQDELVESAMKETINSGGYGLKHTGYAYHQNGTIDVADGKNLNAAWNAKQTVKEMQNISIADPVEAIITDKQATSFSPTPVQEPEPEVHISTVDIIEISDDEEDANIIETSARRRKMVENPEIPVWNCLGPYGERKGPYSLSVLKKWSETASYPLQFKVWKTGQSEKEAILLTDALRQIFTSTPNFPLCVGKYGSKGKSF